MLRLLHSLVPHYCRDTVTIRGFTVRIYSEKKADDASLRVKASFHVAELMGSKLCLTVDVLEGGDCGGDSVTVHSLGSLTFQKARYLRHHPGIDSECDIQWIRRRRRLLAGVQTSWIIYTPPILMGHGCRHPSMRLKNESRWSQQAGSRINSLDEEQGPIYIRIRHDHLDLVPEDQSESELWTRDVVLLVRCNNCCQ